MHTLPVRLILCLGLAGLVAGSCARRADVHDDSATAAPDLLTGRPWKWVRLVAPGERLEVDAPERYTLQVDSAGRIGIRADCNSGGATYRVSESSIEIDPIILTKMACPEGSLSSRYATLLEQVASHRVRGDTLELVLRGDAGTLIFAAGR